MLQAVGLIFNTDKPLAAQVAERVGDWLEKNGVRVITELAQSQGADAMVVLGGDGTLLRAARQVSLLGIPVLGVNLGHLGFLTEIELSDLFSSLEKVVNGDYTLEERMMLKVTVFRRDFPDFTTYALNDAVISRGNISRIINLDISLSGENLSSFPADGLIVSTPTGSTAYSLSAGGPIVWPMVQVMVITPICPHTLSARPMVIDPAEVVEVRFARGIDCLVTFDGQETIELKPGEGIRVERASMVTRLIKLSGRSFPGLMRAKFKDYLHE